jgi:predicted GNAT family N-acyltransferase
MSYRVRTAEWERDRDALKSIRFDVFVVEQNVPESLEWDGLDAHCIHALAEDGSGTPIGCGRLLPDGHIGRIAVAKAWRARGVGAALVQRLIDLARERGDRRVMLNSQTHAMPFYARFGFEAIGEPFDEAGIPHQAMELGLR